MSGGLSGLTFNDKYSKYLLRRAFEVASISSCLEGLHEKHDLPFLNTACLASNLLDIVQAGKELVLLVFAMLT